MTPRLRLIKERLNWDELGICIDPFDNSRWVVCHPVPHGGSPSADERDLTVDIEKVLLVHVGQCRPRSPVWPAALISVPTVGPIRSLWSAHIATPSQQFC